MPPQDHNDSRPDPLSPDEKQRILDALTTGGRSQRDVASDEAIKGSYAQVRAVVREAVRDDPKLSDRYPKLCRRAAPEIRTLEVVDIDGLAEEHTAADSLMAAGVPLEAVRVRRVVTTIRSRPHVVRNADGSFAAIRVQHVDSRVEWVLADASVGRLPIVAASSQQRSLTGVVTSRIIARTRAHALVLGLGILIVAILGALLLGPSDGATSVARAGAFSAHATMEPIR